MNKEQIEIYEYCKKHLELLKTWQEKLPFKIQQYGCGSNRPTIEHSLEKIHRDMFEKIRSSMNDVRDDIEHIIENI